MTSQKKTSERGDDLVVRAGYVTVRTKVGAGMAYVDVPQGERLPDDLSDEDRQRLLAAGAIGRRDGKPADEAPDDEHDAARAARPVPGEVEPDEIDTDVIPGGSTEDVLAWVGDDLARARVARHEEKAKGDKARAGLIEAIENRMKELETEPPTVPEHLDGSEVSPAPAGGVAVPLDEPGEADGKSADEAPAGRTTRGRRSGSK